MKKNSLYQWKTIEDLVCDLFLVEALFGLLSWLCLLEVPRALPALKQAGEKHL
jgi:hypothetical protein